MAAGDSALSLFLNITAVDGATAVVKAIADGLKGLAGDGVLGAVVGAAAAAGVAIAGIGIAATKAAGDFQQAMLSNVAHAGLAKDQVDKVTKSIMDMSVAVGRSPTDLAEALYPILSAFSGITDQSAKSAIALDTLKMSFQAVAGTTVDGTAVAQAAVGVFNALGLATDNAATNTARMTNIFDIMDKTVQLGNMQWDQYKSVISKLAVSIQGTGVSFTEASAALSTMTNEGFNAQKAQTYLSNLFTSVAIKTDVLAAHAKKLGIAFNEQAYSSMNLADKMAYLNQITDGNKQKLLALMSNNATALKAFDALSTGVKAYSSNLDALNHSQGALAMSFAVASEGFNFQMSRMKAASDALLITLGNELLPIFGKVVGWITNIITSFTAWEERTHFVENALGAVVAAVQWVIDILAQFGNVVSQVWSVVGPIFDNLAASAVAWGKNFMAGFGNGVVSVLSDIINIVVGVVTEIEAYLGFASPARKGPGQNILKWGEGLVQGVASGMKSGIHHITDATTQIISQVGRQFSPGALINSGQLQTSGGDLLNVSVTEGVNAQGGNAPAMGTGNTAPPPALSGLQSAITGVGANLNALCSTHATAASKCVSDTLTSGLAKDLASKASSLTGATSALGNALNDLPVHAATVAAKTKAALSKIMPDVSPATAAVDAMNKLLDQIPTSAAKAAAKVPQALSPITAAIKNIWSVIVGIFGNIVNFLRPAFTYMSQTFQSQIIPAWNYFKITVRGLGDDLKVLSGLIIAGLIGAVAKIVTEFGKWIVQSHILKTVWDSLIAGLKALIQGATSVVLFIDNIVIAITRWITSGKAAKDLAPIIQTVVGIIKDQFSVLKQSVEGAITAFQSIWKTVQSQLLPALLNLAITLKPVGLFIAGLIIGIFQLEAAMTKWIATSGVIKVIWEVLAGAVKVYISILSQVINAISSSLQPVFKQLAETFETQVKPAWDHLMAAIKPALPFLADLAKFVGGVLLVALGLLVGVITGVIKGLGGLLQGLIQALGGIIQFVSGFVQTILGILSFFYDLFTGKWSKLGTDLGIIWQGIVDMGLGLMNTMIGIFSGAFNAIIGFVSGFVQGVVTFFTNLYNDLVGHSIIPDMINAIIGWFGKIPTFIMSILTGVGKWLVDQWNTIKNNAIAAGTALLQAVQDGWNKIGAWITKWATDRVNELKTWGTNLIKGFADSITGAVHWVTDAVSNVGNAIKNFLGIQSPAKEGPLSTSDTWMPSMMTMFASGITNNTPKVTLATNALAGSISGSMNKMNNDVTNSVTSMQNRLSQAGTSVSSAMSAISNNVQVSSAATGAALGAIGAQAPAVASQVQSSMSTIQSAMQGAASGAQTTGQTITNANQQVVSSSQQTASAHSTLKTTIVQNSSQMAGSAQSAAQTVSASYSKMVNESKLASNAFATSRTEFQWALDDLKGGAWQGAIHQFQAGVASAISGVQASLAATAAQIAAVLGHSKPKEGPLKDDDLWGKHFMENITGGMQAGMPGLSAVTGKVASVLSGALLSPTISGLPSTAAGISASSQGQPMVIYMQIDGKTIGKVAMQYQARELRVQGTIRNM